MAKGDYDSYDDFLADQAESDYKDTEPEETDTKKKTDDDSASEGSADDSSESETTEVEENPDQQTMTQKLDDKFRSKLKGLFGGKSSPSSFMTGYVRSYFTGVAAKYHIPVRALYIIGVLTGCTVLTSTLGFLFPSAVTGVSSARGAADVSYHDYLNNNEIEEMARDPRRMAFTLYSELSSGMITAEYITDDLDLDLGDSTADTATDPESKDNWDNDKLTYSTVDKLSTEEYFDKYYELTGKKSGRPFSDEVIVGMISNMVAESNVNPAAFEGDYVIVNGLKDDEDPTGTELILYNTHHIDWDTYTPALFEYYKTQGVPIQEDGYLYKLKVTKTDTNGAVKEVDEDHYYPGVGLIGFTGEMAYRLQTYCDTFDDPYDINGDEHNDAMYTMDGQLSFMLYDSATNSTCYVSAITDFGSLQSLGVSGASASDPIDKWMEASFEKTIQVEDYDTNTWWWVDKEAREKYREEVIKEWEKKLDNAITENIKVPLAVWGTYQRVNYHWRSMTYTTDLDMDKVAILSGYTHNSYSTYDPSDERAGRTGLHIDARDPDDPLYDKRFDGDTFAPTSNWDNEAYNFPGPQWTDNGQTSNWLSCCTSTVEQMEKYIDDQIMDPKGPYHTTLAVYEDVRLECTLYDQWGKILKSVEKGLEDDIFLDGTEGKDIIIEACWSNDEIDKWNDYVYGNRDPVNIQLDVGNTNLWRVLYDRERHYRDAYNYYNSDCSCKTFGVCCRNSVTGASNCGNTCDAEREIVAEYCKAKWDEYAKARRALQEKTIEPLSSDIYKKLKAWICCCNEDDGAKGYVVGNASGDTGNDWDNKKLDVSRGGIQIPLHSHFYDDKTSATGEDIYKVYSIRAEAAKLFAKEFSLWYEGIPADAEGLLAKHYTYCDDYATEEHAFYHDLTYQSYGWNWRPNDELAKGICQIGCAEFTNAAIRDMLNSSAYDDRNGIMQNMNPAEMAVAISYPKGHPDLGDISSYVLDVDGCYFKNYCTSMYIAVKDIVCPEDIGVLYSSCDRSLATAVRASGADDFFPLSVKDIQVDGQDDIIGQLTYCLNHSVVEEDNIRWRRVYNNGKDYYDGNNKPFGEKAVTIHGKEISGIPFNKEAYWKYLQPGDILVKVDGDDAHVAMFVGQDVVEDKWPLLCNYGDDEAVRAIVHGSHMTPEEVIAADEKDASRGPRCDPDGKFITSDGKYYVFRAVTENFDSSRYKMNVESLRNYLESFPNGIGESVVDLKLKDLESLF